MGKEWERKLMFKKNSWCGNCDEAYGIGDKALGNFSQSKFVIFGSYYMYHHHSSITVPISCIEIEYLT